MFMQKNVSATRIRRARENCKVTKNQEVKDSPEVKGNFAGSALVHTRTLVLAWNAFPICSREVGRTSTLSLSLFLEGTVRTRDSHKTDFRAPWAATDRRLGRTWKMHQGGVVPILATECAMKRGEGRFQSANMSLRRRRHFVRWHSPCFKGGFK